MDGESIVRGGGSVRTLRDYQEQAKCAIQHDFAEHNSCILVLATGLGKTVVLSRIAQEWTGRNVLVLAHRIELVDQAAQSIAREIGYMPIIEQAERGADPDLLHQGGQVICGSIQTMISQRRLRKYRPFPFGLVIIDECHRAVSPSYRKFLEYFWELNPEMRVLGVTATPNRTDGKALGLVFQKESFQMGIVPGIDQGWLVDVHQKFGIVEEVDFSKIACTKNEFGERDFQQQDLERVLSEEGPLQAMSQPVLDITKNGEQAIIFTAGVNHAHLWAMVLNRYRLGCAAAVDGGTEKGLRNQLVRRYKEGDLQFLLNFGVFTEGFDAPNTQFVVMGRPTQSLLTYTQMLGRGTRPLPGVVDGIPTPEGRRDAISLSAKPYVTVLDFVGNSKHKIVSAVDVLGGNYSLEDKELAAKRLKNKTGNVREEIRKAKAAMGLLLEEEKRKHIKVAQGSVSYQLRDVSPFEHGATPVAGSVKTKRGTLTDNQLSALQALGCQYENVIGYSRKQAGAVLSDLRQKRCTTKQARVLKLAGYNPANYNVESASRLIDTLKENGWRR